MDLNHILNILTGLIGCSVILVGGPYNKFIGVIGLLYCGSHFMVAESVPIYKPLIIIGILFLGTDPFPESNKSLPYISRKRLVRLFVSIIAGLAIVYVGWGYPPGPLVPSPVEA